MVIEVIPHESVTRDTQAKFGEYEKAGVIEYWIIDLNRRTALFYGFENEGKYKLLHNAELGKFESGEVDGLWIKTDWLWQEELPNVIDILREWDLV